MDKESKGMSGALKASIVCLVLGCILMLISLWSIAFYVPLFLASFILSIVAMAKDEVWAGVGMLLGNLIIPSAIFGLMFVMGINQSFNSQNKTEGNSNDSVSQIYNKAEKEVEKEKQSLQEVKDQYIDKVRLYDFSAKYYETFTDEKTPGVNFKLENQGDSTLSYVKVTAYFKDENDNTIYEEDFVPVNTSAIMSDSKPLKPNYIWEMEGSKFLSAESVPSKWQEGNVEAKITDIKFVK